MTVLWDQRIARAIKLSTEYPAAAEVLTFYAGLAEFQKSLLARIPGSWDPRARAGDLVIAVLPEFLGWVGQRGPRRLADAARELSRTTPDRWHRLARAYWEDPGRDVAGAGEIDMFCVEALLQPFAEAAAREAIEPRDPTSATPDSTKGGVLPGSGRSPTDGPSGSSTTCPSCSGLPLLATLREEGQGARRSLVCGFCLTEWDYPRVMCPACGEQQFEALGIYTADQFTHARIDACETCRRYLKTLDLTKDALAVPIVDELASIALDLWARERGYAKLRPNLLRM